MIGAKLPLNSAKEDGNRLVIVELNNATLTASVCLCRYARREDWAGEDCCFCGRIKSVERILARRRAVGGEGRSVREGEGGNEGR
jgi:hypothetical protein